jgi:hypothetical protein
MNSGGGADAASRFSLGGVQRQVKVGAPGDAAEHEADRAAEHVVSGPASAQPTISRVGLLQRQVTEKREPEQTPADGSVRRAEEEPKKESYPAAPVQRATADKKDESTTPTAQRASPENKTEPPAVQRASKEEKTESPGVQRAEGDKKDEAQAPAVQRASKEEKTESPAVQRASTEEKTEVPDVQRAIKKENTQTQGCCGCPEEQMQHRRSGTASVFCKSMEEPASDMPVHRKTADTGTSANLDTAAQHAISTKDTGAPLREPTRRALESRMGVDLSGVRVHEGSAAQESAAALNARAFTHKNDIWLGKGESQDNIRLMAHEATHAVQQGAAVKRAGGEPKHDDEKEPPVRRSLWSKITGVAGAAWDATGGKLVDAAGQVIEMGADFFWSLVKEVAPGIVPIIQDIRAKGIFGYLRDKLTGAFSGIFGKLENSGGFIGGLIKTFSKLLSSAGTIISALGHGDCQPLFDAVSQLGDVLKEMAGEAWDKIKEFFAPIGDFFSDLWNKFGAPVVDFLGQVASDVWEDIKALGRKIWDWTQPVRDALAAAWKWVKDQLGIGDEPEGQDGLLQWVQRKLGEAWDWVKTQLQPIIGPMQALVEKIKAIIPLDAILNLRETVHNWLQHAKDMVLHMRQPQGVTQNQEALREKILPAIKEAIVNLGGKIASAGTWVAGQIGGIASSVLGFFSNLRSNSILGKLSGAIQWVEDKVNSLSEWVQGGVTSLFNTIGKGVARLAEFVEPVLNVLKKIVSVVVNVVKELPGLVLGPVWKALPACIRNPIKDFIIDNILSNIPIIGTFVKIPDIWEKIQKLVMDFLAAVFVNGDLSGAALMVIRFVLEAVGINFDLMLSVLGKAAGALDDIIMHPVEFLSHLLAALSKGFNQFLDNILTHIMKGLLEWILGPLAELGVKPPKDFSLGSLLDLALQILGITADKLRGKLEKALGPTAVKVLEEAWNWISALIKGGFAGLWEHIKDRLSDLWNIVIGGITNWITVSVVKAGIQQLVMLSNPVGAVLEAIKTIYTTIQFVVTKMNKILGVVDAVLDSITKIVAGDIASAANWIEGAMARTVAPVIGFFADWVGISSPGEKIAEIVKGIQERVDKAMDFLIEKAISIGKSLLGALGLGEKPDDRTPEQKQSDLDSAMTEARQLADAPDADEDSVKSGLSPISKKYRLTNLELDPEGEGKFEILGEVNPKKKVEVELAPGSVETVVSYGSVSSTLGGTSMVAHPLTPKHETGSAPSASPGVWDDVRPDVLRRDRVGLYVRGHLLNQQLGGPGTEQNLTPITYAANSDHLHSVEKVLKGMVNAPKKSQQIVHYEVKVAPASRAAVPDEVKDAETKLTRGLSWSWYPMAAKGDARNPKFEKLPGGDSGFVENVPPWPHTGSGGTVQRAPVEDHSGETVRRQPVAPNPPVHHEAPSDHATKPAGGAPIPTEPVSIDGGTFAPSAAWQEALKEAKSAGLDVPIRYRKLASGTIRVRVSGPHKDTFETHGGPQAIPLTHSALEPLRAVDVHPVLVISIHAGVVQGHVTQSQEKAARTIPQPASAFLGSIRKNPNLLGWLGMELTNFPSGVQNELKEGTLQFDVPKFGFRLAGIFAGDASFALNGELVTFKATATAKIPKLDPVVLNLERNAAGHVHGVASTALKFDRFTGSISATYKDGQVDIAGVATYKDEKLNGTVNFIVADAATARNVALEHLGPDAIKAAAEEESPVKKPKAAAKGVALAGWGTLRFRFNDWLNGTVDVVVDDQGHITVIGAIRPDKEVPLMAPKPFHKNIFTIPIQAEYGLPYVGGIGLEVDIKLDFDATVGPAKLYNIEAVGRYSTDPRIAKEFALSASLNLSAYAALSLTVNGALVITILRHDIKAGAGVTATAGVRGYVDARPTIGYRENLPPEQGGKGEFYFKGHAEVAAQPFLGLEGHLFIELSTPWWSPISDHTWTWPIGSLEYVLPGEFGIGMDVEHVIGSGKVPDVHFGEVSFDRDKFMSDVLDDKIGNKTKGEQKVPGKWKGSEPENPVPKPEPKKVEPPKDAGGPKKPATGKQAPEHRKASDPAVAKPWQRAMADIHALAESSKSHPFGPSEIENAVVQLKKHHRFTDIRVTRAGEDWILHAEMGMRGDFKLKARPSTGKPDERPPEQKAVDHEARWKAGVAGVARDLARMKPEGLEQEKVKAKLPEWKTTYGFTELELKLVGDEFDIIGAMSRARLVAKASADNPTEGLAGTYDGLQGRKGDKMTPDHEPQNALLSYVSDLTVGRFKGFKKPFAGTPIASYTKGKGYCLNMFQGRHYQTRTYGTPGVLADAIGKIRTELSRLDEDSPKDKVQKTVQRVVEGELSADQAKVRTIYSTAPIPQTAKDRVEAGLVTVESDNKKWWP